MTCKEPNIPAQDLIDEALQCLPRISRGIDDFLASPGQNTHRITLASNYAHTMAAAAQMAGMEALGSMARCLEEAIGALSSGRLPASPVTGEGLHHMSAIVMSYLGGAPCPEEQAGEMLEDVLAVFDVLMADGGGAVPLPAHVDDTPPSAPPADGTIPEDWSEGSSFYGGGEVPPELLEIFRLEADEHLDNIATHLGVLGHSPDDRGSLQEVRRAVHTLKGSSAMVGLQAIARVAHKMEDLLDRLYDGGFPWSDTVSALLLDTSDKLNHLISGGPADDSIGLLMERYHGLLGGDVSGAQTEGATGYELEETMTILDDAPEVLIEPRVDTGLLTSELMEVFLSEMKEHASALAKEVRGLEQEPSNAGLVDGIVESLDSIRGSATMLGVVAVPEIAGAASEALRVRSLGENGVSGELREAVLDSVSSIGDLLAAAKERPGDGDIEAARGTIARLHALRDSGKRLDVTREGPAKSAAQQQTDTLRVPMQRVNELIKITSELVVSKNAFDMNLQGLKSEVHELAPSADRLRGVTRAVGVLPADREEQSVARDFMAGEISEVSNDIAAMEEGLGRLIRDYELAIARLGRLTGDMQDSLLKLRMVPLSTVSSRLERTVRVTAAQSGKEVTLSIVGGDVELDKVVLDEMVDPLLHIIRNAVDHGIEAPGAREAAGKPPGGRIEIKGRYEGTDVLLVIGDDGKGLDLTKIRQRAIAMGLATEAECTGRAEGELYRFIFEPGFSTSETVSELSGRGVGMDVVASSVEKLRGTIEVESTPGTGTVFNIRLPMVLALTRVVLLRCGSLTLGIPLAGVSQILKVDRGMIERRGGSEHIDVDGVEYKLLILAGKLGFDAHDPQWEEGIPVVLMEQGESRVAFAVDALLEAREVFVKSLGSHLKHVEGVMGATIMSDGSVVVILNPLDLLRDEGETITPMPRQAPASRDPFTSSVAVLDAATRAAAPAPLSTMVVDDSLSIRRALSGIIEGEGWSVMVASNGREALDLIQQAPVLPDVVLTDMEMPVMDGIELASTLAVHEVYSRIPVVMITSKSSEELRGRAQEAGIEVLMVKPVRGSELTSLVRRLAGRG